jgi:hypothetical protein
MNQGIKGKVWDPYSTIMGVGVDPLIKNWDCIGSPIQVKKNKKKYKKNTTQPEVAQFRMILMYVV